MTKEVFRQALRFTQLMEGRSWGHGCPPIVLLSGGECTEHPRFLQFVDELFFHNLVPVILTNGMWLANKELREAVLRPEWARMFIQVTNDPEYYPKAPPHIEDPRIAYIDKITVLTPLGRAARKARLMPTPMRLAPSSFNLRSRTRALGSFIEAVTHQRVAAMEAIVAGKLFTGHCTPSISPNGDVMVGETQNCFKIGTVTSTNKELTDAILNMRCNHCGLEDNLAPEQKRAIGVATPTYDRKEHHAP